MFRSLVIIAALVMNFAFAGEHRLTEILGKDIQLKTYDHAIAGSIKNFVIFGHVDEATATSELTLKKDGQLIKTTFKKSETGLGGTISQSENTTQVRFVKIDAQEQKIYLKINDQLAEVKILADRYENKHFINPRYLVTLANGETLDFHMVDGGACYQFSTHLVMLIAGSYFH